MMITNKNYIIKWIEKSKDEEDYFDKFVYGFFALNAMYSLYYDTSERRAIKDLFRNSFRGNENEFRKIMTTPEFDYFCKRPAIKNCKYNPDRDSVSMRDTVSEKKRLCEKHPSRSNDAMLMILYQIRCNLFHGNKSFGDENDQEIMKNASELLLQYNLIFMKQFH